MPVFIRRFHNTTSNKLSLHDGLHFFSKNCNSTQRKNLLRVANSKSINWERNYKLREATGSYRIYSIPDVDPGSTVVIILANGSEVRGFKPGRGRWIFLQSVKILSMTSFGREVKPWVPRRRFTELKRTSSRN